MTVQDDLYEAAKLLEELYDCVTDPYGEVGDELLDRIDNWMEGYAPTATGRPQPAAGAMGDPDSVTGQQKEMIYLRSLMQGLAEQFSDFEEKHEHWVKENAGRDRYTTELAEGVRKLDARVVACEGVAQGFSFRPIAQPMRDQFADPKVWYKTNQ